MLTIVIRKVCCSLCYLDLESATWPVGIFVYPQKYLAMYEYIAAHDDEVTFREGDIINEVTSACDDGWMVGRVESTGQYGLLPPNYVERVWSLNMA